MKNQTTWAVMNGANAIIHKGSKKAAYEVFKQYIPGLKLSQLYRF